VEVADQRAETVARDTAHRASHDLVTARACASLPVLVELALPLLRTGGTLLAWKGPLRDDDEEVRRGALAAEQLGGGPPRIQPSGLAALGGHRFVLVDKRSDTPDRFPRRPGVAERRPLA
jgi:16S rRNA (guanine527-N7)-methyltransferase